MKDPRAKCNLLDVIVALEPWSIDDAYTHPDDFMPAMYTFGRGTIMGLLERYGLVEFEIELGQKWYRLTHIGRRVCAQHKAGVPLTIIFKPLSLGEKTYIKYILLEEAAA
jgi:hypothetical protein